MNKFIRLEGRKWGLVFAILAPLFYALKSAFVKFAPAANIEVFVFLRFAFDFLLLTPLFIKYRKELVPKQLSLHMTRSLLALLSIGCSVYGIRHLAFVDAILLENTLPLFIPLIVWIWHKEKLTISSGLILFLGFCSLFFLMKPKFDIFHFASLASLGAGFLSAVTAVSIKTLSKTEHPVAILFYFGLFATLVSMVPGIYYWNGVLSVEFLWPFILISVFGVFFQFAIVKAYSLIAPHIVGGFIFFGVLFSAILGWVLWQESLDSMQIFGGIILIGSGILMLRMPKKITSNLDS